MFADVKIMISEVEKYSVYQVVTIPDEKVLFQSLDKKVAIAFCKDNNLKFVMDEVN